MSIFHCLAIDSTTSKEVTTENLNLYCVPRSEKFLASIILKFLIMLDGSKWSFAKSKFDSKQSPIF